MNIILSIRKPWSTKILKGLKPLEFRNNIGKEFKEDTIIYLYESKYKDGCGKVVGQFKIKKIVEIEKSKVGTYGMLLYYVENILKDIDMLKEIKEVYELYLPNYNNSIKLCYLFNKFMLLDLQKDISTDFMSFSSKQMKEYELNDEKGNKLCNQCDEWLKSIGYYNDYEETFYNNYIEIKDVIEYEKPIDLSCFFNKKGEVILKAPMSWCYTKN